MAEAIDKATAFSYPCAAELIARLMLGHIEIVYARDEGNGKIYATLKEKAWRPKANN